MPAFAFNIYPKGFGKQIQLHDACGVSRTIVEQFRIRIRQFLEFQSLRGMLFLKVTGLNSYALL